MADVVVIGGGIGGLSAGIRLLQRGHSVHLVEKETRPGGYAISFARRGYTFDLALHVVPAGGEGQEFHSMTRALGAEVNFIRLAQGFNVALGDFTYQMPNGYEALFSELSQLFPDERKGLMLFRHDLEKYVHCYAPLFEYGVPLRQSLLQFIPKLPHFLKHSFQNCGDYLGRYVTNNRLKAILFQPAAFMGVPMKEFAAINFMMMFYLLMKNGMYTIEGGGQRLTDALLQSYSELGGQISCSTTVEKIEIRRGRAQGICLSNGETLGCKSVIAGNSADDVVNKLAGREHFSEKFLKNFDTVRPSITVLVLNLGIDCEPAELGINSYINMIFPDEQIDDCFTLQNNSFSIMGFSVTAHSLVDPGRKKAGGHTLSIVAGTTADWLNIPEKLYRRRKEETRLNLLNTLENYYPGLGGHIQVSDLATPRTMFRYTANPGGAIMGPSCVAGNHRSLLRATRLPLKNVLLASAWTNRLGGFMQSMKSGILAAEKI